MRPMRLLSLFLLALFIAACASNTKSPVVSRTVGGGGYYQDDGPLTPPYDLDALPNPTPKMETLHTGAMKPYTVLGKRYVPNKSLKNHKEKGIASWYGRKFHGKKTSIGETYDMFAMTGAHKTLALPSYVKVTRVATGKSVIVRLTDRGPFKDGRVIDLSYAAAYKLGILDKGSDVVIVEAIIPNKSGTYSVSTSTKNTAKSTPKSGVSLAALKTPKGANTMILSARRGAAANDDVPKMVVQSPAPKTAPKKASAPKTATKKARTPKTAKKSAVKKVTAQKTSAKAPVQNAKVVRKKTNKKSAPKVASPTPVVESEPAKAPVVTRTYEDHDTQALSARVAHLEKMIDREPAVERREIVTKDFDALEAFAFNNDVADLRGQMKEAAETPLEKTSISPLSYYIQFGSFGARKNAESAKSRITKQLGWVQPAVQPSGSVYRVVAGPYSDRAAAQKAIARIQKESAFKPTLTAQH